MSKYDGVQAEESPVLSRPIATSINTSGPRPVPLLGWNVEALRWGRDPVGYLTALYRKYGTFSAWKADRVFRVFAFSPEHNQRVLGGPDLFHMTPPRKRNIIPANSAMMNLRSGLLSLDGEEHRRHRKLMAPAFHHKQVETYRDTIAEMTYKMLERWAIGKTRDVEVDMRQLVHRIAMKAVLSIEDDNELTTLNDLIEELLSVTPRAFLFPYDLPGSSYRRMMKAADLITASLESLVEKKRADASTFQDILAMIMNARNEKGAGFESAELIAEAYNILCHETSASTLVWILFLLAQHPRVCSDLVDELEGELGGLDPSIEQLSRLPLLDSVIKESMRLIPTAPFGTRFSTEACHFGGCELPKGAAVTFSQYITHRLPEIYQEPQRFLPRRWEGPKPGPYEFFPLGVGVHNCIGGAFAMLEMKVVLAIMLQRYRFTVAPKLRINRVFRMSLRPRSGMPMFVSKQDRRFSKSPVTGNIHEMVDLA